MEIYVQLFQKVLFWTILNAIIVVLVGKVLKLEPLISETKIKVFHCRKCKKPFLTKHIRKVLLGLNEQKEPEKCSLCNSRFWKYDDGECEVCQRCGFIVGLSKTSNKFPVKCPNCGKTNWTRVEWEKMVDYPKEWRTEEKKIRQQEKLIKKEQKIKSKENDVKIMNKFEKNVKDIKENLFDRLS